MEPGIVEVTAMGDNTRSKLIAVGAEALADALLELASRHDRAADMVQRLLASPQEAVGLYRDRLESVTSSSRRRGFIDWRHSGEYADDLCDLLLDLEASNPDPRTGIEGMAAFFAAFEPIIEACDDSSGHVSGVFRFDATDQFVSYAKRCDDHEFLEETVLRLCRDDRYGVTENLVREAPEYLPSERLRRLIDRFKEAARAESRKEDRWSLLKPLERMARRLGDPDLFAWCRRSGSARLSAGDQVDIADAYLEAGDAEKALGWLRKSDPRNPFEVSRRDSLLMTALEQVGDIAGATEVAWAFFRRSRNERNLETLVGFAGEGERAQIVEEGWRLIQKSPGIRDSDLEFLIATGRAGDAAEHLIGRIDQLDASPTQQLVPLAEAFTESGQPLAATLTYRALLDILLAKGQPKSYDRGARHLESLKRLSVVITDWHDFPPHDKYAAGVRDKHGRKWSFWKRVDEGD